MLSVKKYGKLSVCWDFFKKKIQQLWKWKKNIKGNVTLQFCSSINVIFFSNSSLLFRNVWSKAPPVDTLCVVTCKPPEYYVYFASFTGYSRHFTKSTLWRCRWKKTRRVCYGPQGDVRYASVLWMMPLSEGFRLFALAWLRSRLGGQSSCVIWANRLWTLQKR